MKKIFQQKRWLITIIFTIIILVSGFIYLHFTDQLGLFLEFKWQEINKWFLGSALGAILLNLFTALLYGYIFPDKKINNKLDEIQKRLGEMAIKQNRPVEELLQENKELKEKLQKESVANISQELQTEIDQLFSEFKYSEARSSIDKFLQEHKNIKQKDLAKLHYQKSLIYEAEINYPKAKEEIETAIALERNSYKIDSQYGNILHVLGDYDKAIEYHEKALKIRLNKLGEDHLSVATSYNNLGLSWNKKGNHDKAIEYHEKALKIRLNKLDEDHPDIATSYNNLGSVWNDKGNYDKAIKYYDKALKIKLNKLGEDHPSVAISYNNLGYTWNKKGNHDKAIEYHEKALKIKLNKLGKDHPSVATSYNNLGLSCHSKGDYDKAIEYHEKALDILHKTFQNGHPQIDIVQENLKDAREAKNS